MPSKAAPAARGAGAVVVLAEGLDGPPLRPEADRLGSFVLVVLDGFLHHEDPRSEITPVLDLG